MIIELPLETWTDLLPFVPRRQLVKLLDQIADRQFAKNLLFFLTKCGKITLDCQLNIAAAKEESAASDCGGNGFGPKRRRVTVISNRYWPNMNMELADGPMPENISNFTIIRLSYLDISVHNFLLNFQQNSLFDNVNLHLPYMFTKTNLRAIFTYLVPLLGSINSIRAWNISNAGNSLYSNNDYNDHYSQLMAKLLAMPRILDDCLMPNEFDWCFQWLYSPREDGQPRVLLLSRRWDKPIATITPFIDRIKEDFLAAKQPISFFVRIVLPKIRGHHIPSASLDNGQTMEQLVIKEAAKPNDPHWEWGSNQMVLISRYPLEAAANKDGCIEANEAEVLKWDFNAQNRRIQLDDYMKATSV